MPFLFKGLIFTVQVLIKQHSIGRGFNNDNHYLPVLHIAL